MRRFRTLAERQIAKARASGQLTGLKGEGQPLPDRPGGTDAVATGMRIMAEAGVLPEEFALKTQLDTARARLRTATTEEARKAASQSCADLELRYEIAREARRRFMR
ncbi:DUF1992 domain-containing protein [uncultured Roseobacter sp.]|uniref:DnaJ family domain-containing protein n=1 Tax=uncultured Roseobacter sp. TaxID=114847 RepID=UPI002629138B|nr:DUF1992 domain-containing protein [uncultured Roseobacter sp.]